MEFGGRREYSGRKRSGEGEGWIGGFPAGVVLFCVGLLVFGELKRGKWPLVRYGLSDGVGGRREKREWGDLGGSID